MMKRHLTLTALICTLGCLAANAAAGTVTITFDEAGVPTGTLLNNSDFDVAGYHFDFSNADGATISGVGVGGTNAIEAKNGNGVKFKITRIDGGAFTLDGFDLNQAGNSSFLDLSAQKFMPDGGPSLSDVFNTPTGGYVLEAPYFASALITSATFDITTEVGGDLVAIDNIQLTAIPEPASTTLTFDDLTPQSLGNGDSFTLDGYTIDIRSANWAIADPGDGDNALGATGDDFSQFRFTLRRSDGEVFDISSFDLLLDNTNTTDVSFFHDSGIIFSRQYSPTTGFETKTDMPGGLFTEIRFAINLGLDPGEVYVDNFVVTAVPCEVEGDDDGDGVCNPTDACEGFDDNTDTDSDGTPDGCDACASGAASGDTNADGNVDLADYTNLAICLSGPGGGLGSGCECFDFDADSDNDLLDFAEFQVGFHVP